MALEDLPHLCYAEKLPQALVQIDEFQITVLPLG